MEEEIQRLFDRMCDPQEKDAYFFADKLGQKADEKIKDQLIDLLEDESWEKGYLAARALSKTAFQKEALDGIFNVIFEKKNRAFQGAFVQILEEYDLSERFVDILKVFLFGNYKASSLAKSYLDSVEFDISPRTIRKAEKHWNHYLHNPEDEGSMSIKKAEIEPMLEEMKELFKE